MAWTEIGFGGRGLARHGFYRLHLCLQVLDEVAQFGSGLDFVHGSSTKSLRS